MTTKTVSFSLEGINKLIDDAIEASTTPLDLQELEAAIKKADPKANTSNLSMAVSNLIQVKYLKSRTTYSKA